MRRVGGLFLAGAVAAVLAAPASAESPKGDRSPGDSAGRGQGLIGVHALLGRAHPAQGFTLAGKVGFLSLQPGPGWRILGARTR